MTMSLDLSSLRHHSPIPPVVTIIIPPVIQPGKSLQIIWTENHVRFTSISLVEASYLQLAITGHQNA